MVFIVVMGFILFVTGIGGLLAPDPTPDPALPPDPAQQIVFIAMIAVGGVILAVAALGVVRDVRAMRRLRRHDDPPTE
jgi:hypothetical protein